ncbi:MAG: AAA family ATPase [Candidatus Schekmanbacteria bacterium]|nr:AAA family ATPase [Candidatus Schekmanbacteria bacterium]
MVDWAKPPQEPAVSAISVDGYKCISHERRIELRPLTVLAGANSSGKSSIMQPLLLLKQTLEAPFDPGALLLDGPNVRFTSAEQLLSQCPAPRSSSFSVTFELNDGSVVRLRFKRVPGAGIDIEELVHEKGGRKTRIHPLMKAEEIEETLPPELTGLRDRHPGGAPVGLDWAVQRDRCFLSVRLQRTGVTNGGSVLGLGLVRPAAIDALGSAIKHVIHLPGLRGNPARTYAATAVGKSFPGTFETYVASIVSHWQSTKDDRLKLLGNDLMRLGLTWKVAAKSLDDTRVELRVGRLPRSSRGGAQDLVSIADVGFGVSQTLPVLVALLSALPGQIVYLEQPEIHLHPRAQRRLAHVLADAARRGVSVVVETHSALLLRGIQTLVVQEKVAPSTVKLHWFQRERTTGATEVTSADLDADGAFGGWPEDFDDVALDAEREYLDAIELRGAAS